MAEKLFTLIDPKTDNPVCGLANLPADNACFLQSGFKTVGGGVHWLDLELHASVMVQDKSGAVHRMFRVQ